MKKISLFISILFLCISCEDVIDVNLNEAAPRLVIEASINWYKNTAGNNQSIKLSVSVPFYDEAIPPANNATVQITDSSNTLFNFIEDNNSGIYRNSNFIPALNETYTLTIQYQGETYIATETLKSVASIDYIEQINGGGFSGNDTELKAFYTDPIDEENYYFFEFISDTPVIPYLDIYDDEFTNGNQIFSYYSTEEVKAEDEVTIRNYGVSKRFYEFMLILLEQGGEGGGGPFETQPTTVRGNCINQTNPENFPFGYFRLSEVDEVVYTVQ